MERFDVIVVGLGGIGSAAAFHLAARGTRVLGLDRFPIAHDRGSSHGQTRLIRRAYFEHPDYVPLLDRAYALWHDLEARSGRRLLVEAGLLLAGPRESDVLAGAIAAAERHAISIEQLCAADACRRWPQFTLPEGWVAVHEPQAGYLFVEACVAAHAAAAEAAGAIMRTATDVRSWRPGAEGVVVTTDTGEIAADKLVLAPGPWASGLLDLPGIPLVVLRKSLFWYRPEAGQAAEFAAGTLPCFAFARPDGFFYGFPALDGRGVKIAEHTGGTVVADPLAIDRTIDAGERHTLAGVIAAHLPRLGTAVTDHAACLYTMSPDHHFLVGLHPDHARVAIAAGFSGHGFKFASVIGEALADLALTGTTPLPLGFLSPTRFC